MSTPPSIPPFTLSCASVRGTAKNVLYRDDHAIRTLDDLLSAAQWDHTPAGFADGVRGNGRWRCTECVVLDVDNDPGGEIVTPDTIRRDFPDVAHYIMYSRHHNQPKGGKPAAPRFHAYFPIGLLTDAAAVKRLIDDVLGRCSYFDPACSDLARFFFGVEHPEGEAVPGDLTLDSFMERQTLAHSAPAALTAPATSAREIVARV